MKRKREQTRRPYQWVNLHPGNDRELMAGLWEKERLYHRHMAALCRAAGVTERQMLLFEKVA